MLFRRRTAAPEAGPLGPVRSGLDALVAVERSLDSRLFVASGDLAGVASVAAGSAADAVARAFAAAATGRRAAAFATTTGFSDALPTIEQAVARRVPFVVYAVADGPWDPALAAGLAGAVVLAVPDVRDVIAVAVAARRAAEEALLPVVCIADASLIAHAACDLPEPADLSGLLQTTLDTPDPVQKIVFGERRPAVPAWLDADHPMGLGARLSGHDAAAAVAARRLLLDVEIAGLVDRALSLTSTACGRSLAAVVALGDERSSATLVTAGPAPAPASAGRAWRTVQCVRLFPFPVEAVAARVGRSAAALLLPADPAAVPARFAAAVGQASGRPLRIGALKTGFEPDLSADFEAVATQLAAGTLPDPFFPSTWRTTDRPGLPEPERLEQRLKATRPGFDRALVRGSEPRETAPYVVFGGPLLGSLAEHEAAPSLGTGGTPVRTWRARPSHGPDTVAIALGDAARHPTYGRASALVLESAAELDRLGLHDLLGRGTEVVVPDPERISAEAVVRIRRAGARLRRVEWPGPGEARPHALERPLALLSAAPGASGPAFAETARRLVARLVQAGLVGDRVADDLLSRLDGVSVQDAAFPTSEPPEPLPPSVLEGIGISPESPDDPVRFWRTVGFAHASGRASELIPDPYRAIGALPARAGWAPTGSGTPPALPSLVAERCTGCVDCFAACPQGAIEVAAFAFDEALDAAFAALERTGSAAFNLSRLRKPLAQEAHKLFRGDLLNQFPSVPAVFAEALERTLVRAGADEAKRSELQSEFASLTPLLPGIPLARTRGWMTAAEETAKGSGRAFTLAVDPDRCSACGLCVAVCREGALESAAATPDSIAAARAGAAWCRSVPAPPAASIAAVSAESAPARLLEHRVNDLVSGADDAFHATLRLVAMAADTAVSNARAELRARIAGARSALQEAARKAVTSAASINDFDAFSKRLAALGEGLTPDRLLSAAGGESGVDADRVRRLTDAERRLGELERAWTSPDAGRGRARTVAVVDADFAATWPVNPASFPWLRVAPGTGPAAAEAVVQSVREVWLADCATLASCEAVSRDVQSAVPTWESLSEAERRAAPAVLLVTDRPADGTSRLLAGDSGVRVLLLTADPLDAGYSDPALAAAALGSSFVAQGSIADVRALASFALEAFACDGPALLHAHVPPGPVDDAFAAARDAVAGRVFPAFRMTPGTAEAPSGRFDLGTNPLPTDDWADPDAHPIAWAGLHVPAARDWTVVRRGEAPAGLVDAADALLRVTAGPVGLARHGDRVALVPAQVTASARRRVLAWKRLRAMAAAARAAERAASPVEAEAPAAAPPAAAPAPVAPALPADALDRLTTRLLALSGFAPGDARGAESLRSLLASGDGASNGN